MNPKGCELCGSDKHDRSRCNLNEYLDIIQETENLEKCTCPSVGDTRDWQQTCVLAHFQDGKGDPNNRPPAIPPLEPTVKDWDHETDEAPVDAADAGDRLFLMVSVAVKRERDYQDAKYSGDPHELLAWLAIMQQELDEAKRAYFEGRPHDSLSEVLQVAAVGFAAMEEHGIIERQELRGMAALTAPHIRDVFDQRK